MNTNFHTESRMREICTYGSMRGRAYPTRGVPLYSTPSESPLFFEAEKGPVDNFSRVDNSVAVFISHLAFRRPCRFHSRGRSLPKSRPQPQSRQSAERLLVSFVFSNARSASGKSGEAESFPLVRMSPPLQQTRALRTRE